MTTATNSVKQTQKQSPKQELIKQNLLFIHGFNSSPLSFKAEQTKAYMQVNFPQLKVICPQLNCDPFKAVSQLEEIIKQSPANEWLLIGSSLGGFFATYLANKFNIKATLINPAVRPYELSEQISGEQFNPYTQESYSVSKAQIESLKNLETDLKNKNNFFIMAQTGDEVLDYQKAVQFYQGCKMHIEEGGDHSFINFPDALPMISKFLNIR